MQIQNLPYRVIKWFGRQFKPQDCFARAGRLSDGYFDIQLNRAESKEDIQNPDLSPEFACVSIPGSAEFHD